MMINISLSSEDIAQLNLLRDLMNFIRNGIVGEIQKIDPDKLSAVINKVDPDVKQTPLLAACLYPNEQVGLEMIKVIVDRGANPLYKDNNQQTVMYYLARDGKVKIAEFLLNSFQYNLNDTDFCTQTPIFYAARDNRLNVVQLFVAKGANVNHKDQNGQTCLFYAAREGHYDMCKFLIRMGVQVSHLDAKKRSALHFAKKSNHQNIVDLLNSSKQQQKKSKQIDKVKQKDSSMNEKKKPKKQSQKVDCVLVFTDQAGNVHELNEAQIQEFKKHNQRIFNLMCNPELLEFEPTPSEKKFEKVANKILNNLWKMPGAIIFHTPVDWQAHGLKDYPTIVKRPMDFGTIKIKLQNNAYESHSRFAEDMLQVFQNCILYNGSEHEYGKIALNLKKEFSSAYNEFFV